MSKRLVKNQVLLARVADTPDENFVVDMSEPFTPSYEVKSGNYKALDGKMGTTKTWVVPDYMAVSGSFNCMLKDNGGGDSKPLLDEMFKMSGFDGEAVDTDDDDETDTYRYTPNSSELANGNIIFYLDGIKRSFSGISANLKFDFEVGTPAKVSFDIKGFSDKGVEEANPSVTLDSNALFVVSSVQAVTFSGDTIALTKCSFDLGNSIQEIYAIGQKEFYRSDFSAKVSLSEKVGSDISYWDDFLSGAVKSLEVELESVNGNKFKFVVPSMSYINVSESGSDELEVSREFYCGNDFYFEFS